MNETTLALLVDGENIGPTFAEEILHVADKLGDVSERMVFGDFRRRPTPPWKSPMVEALGYDICHVQSAFRGSNSTDKAICRAARRLVNKGKVEAVCIVSADKHFATLAEELIAAGTSCFGIGPRTASKKLKSACSTFLCLGRTSRARGPLSEQQIRMLRVAVTAKSNKKGWAKLQAVDEYLHTHSTLYQRNRWGFASVRKVFMATDRFEIQDFQDNHRRIRHID